jgi:hypothetical protein
MKTVAATGEKLVDVDLVTDVPDEFVLGRAENTMQRERELDHAEVGSKMAAIPGEHSNQFMADFISEQVQLLHRQFFDVQRTLNHVEVSAHIF